jgi:hypothetical protein
MLRSGSPGERRTKRYSKIRGARKGNKGIVGAFAKL